MRVIEKFVCEKCGREYYDRISSEKCELLHRESLVLSSYLTHLAQVAPSGQIAVDHVVNCDWCRNFIKDTEDVERRDLALQKTRRTEDL